MYKIKYLERLESNAKGNKTTEKTMTVSYSDADLLQASLYWRSNGFIEVQEVIVFDKAKKTASEVVEMFYTEKAVINGKEVLLSLDDDDKAIKEALLQKYSGKKAKKEDIPDQIPEKLTDKRSPEEEKEYRKSLFSRLEEAGVKVAKNLKTEDLEAKLKTNGI